jgi:hypothetical protein
VNFLVLIHDVFTGNVVRQVIVKAANAVEALAATDHLVHENEHSVAVATGSEPTIQPPPAEDLAEIHETPELEPVVDIQEPVIPSPPDPAVLIMDELNSLPPDVLERVRAALAENA